MAEKKTRMEYYEELMAKKQPFAVAITSADMMRKVFKSYDHGIQIEIPFVSCLDESVPAGAEPVEQATAFVGTVVDVYVVKTDPANNVIQCSRELAGKYEALRNKINTGIMNGKPYMCNAVVCYVTGHGKLSCAIVRLDGTSIKARVWLHDWSTEYVSDLHEKTKPGDVIRVAVTGPNDCEMDKGRIEYKASRELALGNPWKGVGSMFHKGDICVVTISGPWQENYCGRVEGFPEICVKVDRPAKDSGILMAIGGLYQCTVLKCAEDYRKFEVMPIRVIKTDL